MGQREEAEFLAFGTAIELLLKLLGVPLCLESFRYTTMLIVPSLFSIRFEDVFTHGESNFYGCIKI